MGLSDKTKGNGDPVDPASAPAEIEPPDSKKATVIMKAFVLPEEPSDATVDTSDTDLEASDTDGGADDWGGWDPDDAEEFWYRVQQIDAAVAQGDAALAAALGRYGLRDRAHLDRVRGTFTRHATDEKSFAQAELSARARKP